MPQVYACHLKHATVLWLLAARTRHWSLAIPSDALDAGLSLSALNLDRMYRLAPLADRF
jgi:hypothetical protein